jgi:phage gp29-like protein
MAKLYYNERDAIELPDGDLSTEIARRSRSLDFAGLNGWLPNPDPILRKAGKSIATYKELTYDAHVGGALASRRAGTLSKDWFINGEEGAEEATRLVDFAFRKLNVRRLITEILSAVPYGYQPLEVIWEEGDFTLPARVQAKPADWFCFDSENRLRFRSRESSIEGEILPPFRFLCAQHNPSYDNPYGEAILSRVFWPATFKKGGVRFLVQTIEKHGSPWIIAKYPRGTKLDKINELVAELEAVIQDGVTAVPEGTEVSITAPSTASSDIHNALLVWCNSEISKGILGHTGGIDSTAGKLGSEDAALEARADLTATDQGIVEDTLSELASWIVELNYGSSVKAPRFELYKKGDINRARAERDGVLRDKLGVRFTRAYVTPTYSLEEEDYTLEGELPVEASTGSTDPAVDAAPIVEGAPAPAAAPAFSEDDPCPECGHFEEPPPAVDAAAIADQREVDQLAPGVSKETTQAALEACLPAVFEYLRGERDYTETIDGLASLLPAMETGDLESTLAEIIFVANAIGRVSVNAER